MHLEVMEVRDEGKEQRTEPVGELKNFILDNEHPDQIFSMNAGWVPKQKKLVMTLIRNHSSIFP